MTVTVDAPQLLVVSTRQALRAKIEGAIAAGHDVDVNLAATGYVDTSAIGMLLRASRQARELGQRLTLRGCDDDCREYFARARLLGVLTLA